MLELDSSLVPFPLAGVWDSFMGPNSYASLHYKKQPCNKNVWTLVQSWKISLLWVRYSIQQFCKTAGCRGHVDLFWMDMLWTDNDIVHPCQCPLLVWNWIILIKLYCCFVNEKDSRHGWNLQEFVCDALECYVFHLAKTVVMPSHGFIGNTGELPL